MPCSPTPRFVMTHRDPTDVMVSMADVYHQVGKEFSDDLDLHYLGRLNVDQWATGIARLLEFRHARHDDRFFDIDFRAMQSDPVGEVGRLYDWLGETVSPEFEAGMKRWWADNAEHREDNVHPEPDVFGLDLDEVRTRFAAYTARDAGLDSEVAGGYRSQRRLRRVAWSRVGGEARRPRRCASR